MVWRVVRQYSGLQNLAAAIALLAMSLRALLPASYMYAPSTDGHHVAVTICTGHGPAERLFDPLTGTVSKEAPAPGDEAPDERQSSDAACVFASIAPLSSPVSTVAFSSPIEAAATVLGATDYARPGLGLAAPPPFATGPPHSA
jgi:hypothetical protein